MDCEEYRGLVMVHFDGDLGGEDRHRLDGHLAECTECRALFSDLGAVVNVLETEAFPEPPAEAEATILSQLEALCLIPCGKRRATRGITALILGAVLLLSFFGLQMIDLSYFDGIVVGMTYLDRFSTLLWQIQVVYQVIGAMVVSVAPSLAASAFLVTLTIACLVFIGAIKIVSEMGKFVTR
jgi:predicted anti-sigma-YlaC factor YlaD